MTLAKMASSTCYQTLQDTHVLKIQYIQTGTIFRLHHILLKEYPDSLDTIRLKQEPVHHYLLH